MKKARYILSLLLFSLFSFAQTDSTKTEGKIKIALYSSVITDGGYIDDYATIEDFIAAEKKYFDRFEFVQTNKVTLYKPNGGYDSISTKYQIQLFKIKDDNSKKQHRYLIWYKDFNNTVWLRVSGYVENDLNLLFDYLHKQKVSKKQLKIILREWNNIGGLFEEPDWNCLLDGYLKNKTTSECFLSVYYIRENDLSIGFDPLSEKELYSRFAKSLLGGYFYIP